MVKKYQLKKISPAEITKVEIDESGFQINYKNTLNPPNMRLFPRPKEFIL
jgi:hypothetical protein